MLVVPSGIWRRLRESREGVSIIRPMSFQVRLRKTESRLMRKRLLNGNQGSKSTGRKQRAVGSERAERSPLFTAPCLLPSGLNEVT